MKPATCAVCGAAEAYPMFGHTTPLCRPCDREWQESPERQAAARARQDFVERRRLEGVSATLDKHKELASRLLAVAEKKITGDKDWGAA